MGRIAGYEGRERPKFLVVLCVCFFFTFLVLLDKCFGCATIDKNMSLFCLTMVL